MFVVHTSNCHGQNCTRRAIFRLGIDTLIASILVVSFLLRHVDRCKCYRLSSTDNQFITLSIRHYYSFLYLFVNLILVLTSSVGRTVNNEPSLVHCVKEWPQNRPLQTSLKRHRPSFHLSIHRSCLFSSAICPNWFSYTWVWRWRKRKPRCRFLPVTLLFAIRLMKIDFIEVY